MQAARPVRQFGRSRRQGAQVTIFVRDVSKGSNVHVRAAHFGFFQRIRVVVNATPVVPLRPQDQLHGARWVYDLVYNPIETQLLRDAREAGCETLGGLEMLVAQAKIQFELWTGKKAL